VKVLSGDWRAESGVQLKRKQLKFRKGLLRSERMLIREIASCAVVAEGSKASTAHKLGWGLIGSLFLGPIGFVLFYLYAGRNKTTMALAFSDGRRALVQGSEVETRKLNKRIAQIDLQIRRLNPRQHGRIEPYMPGPSK
jgi:hypothetical protein